MHIAETGIEALSTLIAKVTSSLRVEDVLDHATEVCTELTGCEGAIVYLWDDEQERLVVRGASEGYRPWIGRFSLRLGEGLTGWSALNRRSATITEHPLADPRYKLVPELRDNDFESVLTVPMIGREGRLVGVLTLHTTAPHEYAEEEVRITETVARLMAGAVENATLHEQALRGMEVFEALADIARRLTSASQAPETLQRLALMALELLDAALVVVLRLDEPRGLLTVETWVGGDTVMARPDALPIDGHWSRLLGGVPTSLATTNDDPVVHGLGLRSPVRSLFAAPLVYDGRPTGLLCCYASQRRVLGGPNRALLGTIANHAAVALEESRLSATASRSRRRELFEALRAGENPAPSLAGELGIRLTDPHAVVVAEASPSGAADPDWRGLEARLREVFPATVVDERPRTFAALVAIRSEAWPSLLYRTISSAFPELDHADVVCGFSDSTAEHGDYALAFRQARMVCAIARSSSPQRRARGYHELGAERYLWVMSQDADPDPLEFRMRRLGDVDRERGSHLLRTLEAYLEQRGNIGRAAGALFVHRNTLRQRLRRIHELIGLDPTDPSVWFELMLAVRLVRFRELGLDGPRHREVV